jgi:hypothetical protein
MRLSDLIHEGEEEELAAISQFFVGNEEEPDSMSVEDFADIAARLGLSVDAEKLQQYVQQNKIGNIANVSDTEVEFDSDEKIGPEMMGKDKAEMVVKQAAKRAAKKHSK